MKKRATKKTKLTGKSSGFSAFKKALPKSQLKKKKKPVKGKKVDPLWKLEDGVTYSILSKFSNCRQRFHIGKVQGWKPKSFNYPLEFGNIFHLLSEAQDMGYGAEVFTAISNNYINTKIDEGSATSDEIRDLSILAGVADITFRKYLDYWKKNHSFTLDIKGKEKRVYEKDFNWRGKEEAFDLQYRMLNGRMVRIRGKIDGMFDIRKITKGNWLFETKTKGKIDTTLISEGLHKDLQTGMYMTAMEMLDRGVTPRGVIYNVIRRTQLKPRKNEKAVDFVQRVEEDIDKRPEWYFMRWIREITPDELSMFKIRQFEPQLHQITTWWNSIKGNPLNPFETTCDGCNGSGVVLTDEFCRDSSVECRCNGTGVVPNLEHYERGFSDYDSMYSGKGDYFPIITQGNFTSYEKAKYAFPELEEEDSVDHYM